MAKIAYKTGETITERIGAVLGSMAILATFASPVIIMLLSKKSKANTDSSK